MSALLALIPGKDWFYGALIIGGAVLCWHFYDKYESAVNYAATVKQESAQALADAKKTIADLTTSYDAARKADKETYDKALADAAVQHATDTERLRGLAAARASDSVLSGASGLTAAIAAWSDRLSRVEGISGRLADALRQDDAAALACYADRDALTGK